MAQHREDAGKAQTEVERLLEILKETENEKNDKEKKIHELERWVKGGTMSWSGWKIEICAPSLISSQTKLSAVD